ncbi:MAG: Stage V sporulation protein E [candidate division WWE3 bacterium GW2011_GWF2_41_45]|nr:MAG: Stage V sporulation protein E [candidate division WWE3 bacterium GW2011_GWC2_41_23]KKS09576.1 MAG: Stage V sporulation protein E [candidate division WWE3 bacterium GW2011_GWF2_41_45]KKS11876.1 MAG: Stage V sporulation protein E [candidate division WWE3 bacterium GW2011_GWF1_41_53]KKS19668.1 MAG: Stage V sporulation protein E [candidate division WWE3 bacterium GW2011_GWE1_41_72]KKS30392.1 MAG: Stage V sporulation protein E [candidate division WWE3 bacterium GW2011_GWD2_42_11]KKS50544.1 
MSKKDRSFVFLILGFLLFGIIIIADSTIIHSDSLYNDPYRFVFLQIGWVLLGLAWFFFFYNQDYKKIDKITGFMFGVTIIFLILLAFVSLLPCSSDIFFAPCINGANRWFYLNAPPLPKLPILGVVGFQPGELAKLTLIMYLGIMIPKKTQENKNVFSLYAVATGLIFLLVIAQPNMSTAVMIAAIGTIVYFSSGASIKPLLMVAPAALLLGILLVLSSPYRRERWLTQLKGFDNTDRKEGYHIKQVQIALGSGGFFGVGFGQSRQKYYYLPEVASDSIFAIIGEEFGFLGTALVIVAFSYLIYRGFEIAKNAKTQRGRLLAAGITSWIGLQFFVNIGAMTQLLPLTGVPIPLISYGGSSMVFSLMGLGILANIGKDNSK